MLVRPVPYSSYRTGRDGIDPPHNVRHYATTTGVKHAFPDRATTTGSPPSG